MDSSPLAFLARLASLALLRRRAPRAPEGLTVGRAFALAEGSEAGRACWAFRVSARRTLDPTLDVVFKLLFTSGPDSHDVLIALLTAVLRPRSPFAKVTVLNPESRARRARPRPRRAASPPRDGAVGAHERRATVRRGRS